VIVISFLAFTLLLAVAALQLIRRSISGGPQICGPRLLLALSLSLFVFLYGAWVYVSAYGKYAFALAALIIMAYSLLRRGRMTRRRPPARRPFRDLALSIILLAMNVLYFTGTAGPTPYAKLRFPLKAGRYFVLQGGKGLPANVFHFNSRRAVYAMDIVQLDALGRRCSKVFSRKLRDYYIFGDTVYSPCDGIVRRAVSDNPDNIPPRRKRGPNNLNGIVLEGAEYIVYMGHLRQNGVFVRAGQRVQAGQPLGLVGNSGMSLEPHLHIQVHTKALDDAPWYRQPQLFIKFNDREYLLFQEIDAR
jgi:hypothetical protein